MAQHNVTVVSIHPDPVHPLCLDVRDILEVLSAYDEKWIWCVRNLDCLGADAETFCQEVEAAGQAGLWMKFQELRVRAAKIYQTIEGEFWAFPRDTDPKKVTTQDLNLRAFPNSMAELVIEAIDGGFFEVYLKQLEILTEFKALRDVRLENANAYF